VGLGIGEKNVVMTVDIVRCGALGNGRIETVESPIQIQHSACIGVVMVSIRNLAPFNEI